MNQTRKIYPSRFEKIVDFAIGFTGWFILTALSGLISTVPIIASGAVTSVPINVWFFMPLTGAGPCLIYPAWAVILAILFRWRHWLAVGGATAFVLALVVAAILSLAAGQILSGWK